MDELRDRIRHLLRSRSGRPLRLGEMMAALGLAPSERRTLRRLLRDMAIEGLVSQWRGHLYSLPARQGEVVGILRTTATGFGFVTPEMEFVCGDDRYEIFVPRKRMADAMHGDKVLVRVITETAKSPEGQVLRVIERGTKQIVGTYYNTQRGGQVIPRDERFNRTVLTRKPPPHLRVANGDYVLCRIIEWTSASEPLAGEVVELLGSPDTPGIDVTMIIRDAGVDPEFPAAALAQAAELPAVIPPQEIARRRDFRDMVTFTMDGATAKDFDDALSIERLDDGMWRLGVHIADVAHYVPEGSPLDAEAYERATSIYPVDRVVPMLPERLSNDLCSLRPDEDRLTMSCLMEIDAQGRVWDYEICEGIIRSRHRLVYETVQLLADGKAPPDIIRRIGDVRPQLEELYRLREVLTRMRIRRGALDLDVPETEVELDASGRPVAIHRRPRLGSHRVVEECMLIANEVVAAHLFNLHIPSVYRVHEDPNTNKLRKLIPVLAHMGVKFPAKKDITPEAIQAALSRSEQIETGFIARRLILRAMMRAHYHDENLGHYGLASDCYTHFTSPIRRYPDLIVHRLLKEAMRHGAPMSGRYAPPGMPPPEHGSAGKPRVSLMAPPVLPEERISYLRSVLGDWTKHCSERERRAEEIENEATSVKALEYMRDRLGQEFDGYVTSVLNWGFFVELDEIPVDGLVHIRTLDDDFYEYDEEHMLLTGRQSGRTYRIGDRVRVVVENVSVSAVTMDLVIVRKYASGKESYEERQLRHARKRAKAERHAARRPRFGGFQRRGRRRH
jgi:ribonuclease R